MSTNKPTHQDVIDYINFHYKPLTTYYKQIGNKLVITYGIEFDSFKFNTLPSDMVFEWTCDLSNSDITSVPEDIVLNNSLHLCNTTISTLPSLDVSGFLHINGTDIKITDGTYIEYTIMSERYSHIQGLLIRGYFFSTGILS